MKRIALKCSVALFAVAIVLGMGIQSTSQAARYGVRVTRATGSGGVYIGGQPIVNYPAFTDISGFNYPQFGGYGPTWHDTSHLHYHPGRLVPHGDHFHAVPGHYHLHQSGHWDW